MKIAVMQPAFIPPASYFRLFAAADLFVVYDDVQFNRRWYTHRQKLTKRDGTEDWLTLPLAKSDRDTTRICDLKWGEYYFDGEKNIYKEWWSRLKKFPICDQDKFVGDFSVLYNFLDFMGPFCAPARPLQFVVHILAVSLSVMSIPCKMEFSSSLDLSPDLRAQARILAICKHFGATEYINSPGGRALYDEAEFARHGIKLTFLPEWKGSNKSILERLAYEKPEDVRAEIMANL